MSEVLVGFYADDFTGATDALLQFRRCGWRGRLLLTLPTGADLTRLAHGCDVVGIAGIARSLRTEELDAEVRPALEALVALRPRVVQYKACSTADSSPTVGSLGRVAELGASVTGSSVVPALFAQPDFGRYTAFGHHFAAEGGVVHRLDRQPTMAHHPVTPMAESDLRLHLARQTALPVGGIDLPALTGAEAVLADLRARTGIVVLDAVRPEDLAVAAGAVAGLDAPAFAIGSGGLSRGLAEAIRPETPADSAWARRSTGPVLVLSGSQSPQTRRQISHAERLGWLVQPLTRDAGPQAELVAASLAGGRSAVVHTQHEVQPDAAVAVLAGRLAALARAVGTRTPLGSLVVCGGDTSSRFVRELGADALEIVGNPVANVPLCLLSGGPAWLDRVPVVLKGGQVGPEDLFQVVERG